jgi:hypothetical protein
MAKTKVKAENNTYCVSRYWEAGDQVTVNAPSVEEAIKLAHAKPLSENPDFVPDSMHTDKDADVQILKDGNFVGIDQ